MGIGINLASLFVEFSVKNVAPLKDALAEIGKRTDTLGEQVGATGAKMDAAWKTAASGMAGASAQLGPLAAAAKSAAEQAAKLGKSFNAAAVLAGDKWKPVDQQTRDMAGKLNPLANAARAVGAEYAGLGQRVDNGMKKISDQARQRGDDVKHLGDRFRGLGDVANGVLATVTGSITGLFMKGFLSSGLFDVFSLQFERLSRTFAGLFGPEIRAVTDFVGKLADRINGLSAGTKQTISYLLQGAAAATVAGLVFPKLAAAVGAVTAAVKGLSLAFSAGLSATGIGAFLPLLGLAVQGITMFLVGTEEGREILGEMVKAFEPLVDLAKELAPLVRDGLVDSFRALAGVIKEAADEMRTLVAVVKMLPKGDKALEGLVKGLTTSPLAFWSETLGFAKPAPPAKPGEEDRGALAPRMGAASNLPDIYRILQEQAIKSSAGKKPEERAADTLDHIERRVEAMQLAIQAARPGVAGN